MSTTTTRLSLLKPAPTEVANYLTALNNNWDTIDTFMQFKSESAFPGSPITGKSVQIGGSHPSQAWVYNGTTWIPLGARHITPAAALNNTTGTTTSLTFTQTLTSSSVVEATLRVDESGIMYVTVEGELTNSGANTTFMSYEIRENNVSGAIVAGANDRKGIIVQDTNNGQFMFRRGHTGLTAWGTYYVRLMHRVDAGTGSFFRRRLILEGG